MSVYITIDGGTTNTRINLVKDYNIIGSEKLSMGAGSVSGNETAYKSEIKKAIETLLSDNGIGSNAVVRILASGMITSEYGLCHLDHINLPAGITELHETMQETIISEISDIPFVFVRGVKNLSDNIGDTDMMRGEETELYGIMSNEYGKCVYVLPGSHSKIIKTDEEGRITDFSTMLTGEMINALSQHTILKDAVDLKESETDADYLLKGYDYCKEEGINKALFKVRILKNIFGCNKKEIYSFFLGVILCDEIEAIINGDFNRVVIGGRSQIKNAMVTILKNRTAKIVIALDENDVNSSTSVGVIRIFENRI